MRAQAMILLAGLSWMTVANAWSLYQTGTQTVRSNQEALAFATDQFASRLGLEMSNGLVPFDQVRPFLANQTSPTLFEVLPQFVPTALALGWRPVLKFQPAIQLGIYQVDRQSVSLARLATPPSNSLAAMAASRLAPRASVFNTDSHTECIRAVVVGTADGCLTAPYFAEQYQERFGINLWVRDALVTMPSPLIMANVDLPTSMRQALESAPLDYVGIFQLHPLEGGFDRDAYVDLFDQ